MAFSLRTNFGGLELSSPVLVGACPLSLNESSRVAMQTAGAGAIVLPSLFEEQVIRWSQRRGRPITAPELAILDQSDRTKTNWAVADAESYLSLVNRASSVMAIPLIASLNGFTAGGWMDFAGELEEAGASAIELNVHHYDAKGFRGTVEMESAILDAVQEINASITIPLFVKLGRDFTSIAHLACQLLSGAQGLVLFGRKPTVDICLDSLTLASRWSLTSGTETCDMLDTLMQVHSHCPAMPLAASGGIATADPLIKSLLAGADVGLITSAIYREGPDVIRTILDGLIQFMESHQLESIDDLRQRRPLRFSGDESRSAYIAALASTPDRSSMLPLTPTLHSNRWGHVES